MEFAADMVGLEEVERNLRALPGLLGERVQGKGLLAAARVVEAEAKKLVPVETGRLQGAIKARTRAAVIESFTGRRRVPGGAAIVRAGVPYAHLVEYGTVTAAGKPFLRPAVLGTESRQFQAAVAAIREEFPKLERRLRQGRVTRTDLRVAGF